MGRYTVENLAKIVAGTYIEDSLGKAKDNPVYAWVQKQCREGSLRPAIESFVKNQLEALDPSLVLVEAIGPQCIECTIPCRDTDHESTSTFLTEVKFKINPATFHVERLSGPYV